MNNTDPTSFKSILAGVKKLRDQEGGSADKSRKGIHPELATGSQDSSQQSIQTTASNRILSPNTKVINTFNQQRPPVTSNTGNFNNYNNGDKPKIPGRTVLVNTTQKENPLLNHLKNTNWRYISSTPVKKIYYDYFIKDRSVLFLTLSYHKLYTDYILRRMKPLSTNEDNILIFVVDDNATRSEQTLTEITKLCMFNGFTLLVAFNFEQAAKYIEYLNL